MENFISTVVFILPGFITYFWLQSFGINPVVRHSSVEQTAISTLLWLPVSLVSLLIYNALIKVAGILVNLNVIQNLDDLRAASDNFVFLILFLGISMIVSFTLSAVWSKWGFKLQLNIINRIRTWRGVAAFSRTSSVWDELFLNNDIQIVEIGKIDNMEQGVIGEIQNASRTFEPERLSLRHINHFTQIVKEYKVPVSNIFFDIKSGTYVKVFDFAEVEKAQLKYAEKQKTTSSEDQES